MGDGALELVEQRLESLYGPVDWSRQEGVLQVVAIAASPRAVIAVGPAAPASGVDRFVLGAARARADLVLTSGAILRAEPALLHRYSDDPEQDGALQRWRRERLGRDRAPGLGVLSRSGQIPADHPALRFASTGFVWTSRSGRKRLGPRVGSLEVIDANEGAAVGAGAASRRAEGLGGAIAHALSSGAGTVLVEAGPTLTRALYPEPRRVDAASATPAEPPALLDELLLSCFEGTLDPSAIGPGFVSEAAVGSHFPDLPSERRVEEPSGPWRFLRYRRAPVPAHGKTDT